MIRYAKNWGDGALLPLATPMVYAGLLGYAANWHYSACLVKKHPIKHEKQQCLNCWLNRDIYALVDRVLRRGGQQFRMTKITNSS